VRRKRRSQGAEARTWRILVFVCSFAWWATGARSRRATDRSLTRPTRAVWED